MITKCINRILNLVILVALVIFTTPMAGAHAAGQLLPVESLLNPDGTFNTSAGASGALDLRGWNITLDSRRGPILSRAAPASAAPNAETWSALADNGLNGYVRSLAMSGSDLYVGGRFAQTADGKVTNLNNIVRYSGGFWFPLANNGLDVGEYGKVDALAVSGSDLYVGGEFTQTADGKVTNLNNIARYSGGAWYPLVHNGVNKDVWALAVSGSDLYVGGEFTQTFDGAVTNLNNIARYSGGAWYPLAHNGLFGFVNAFAVSGSDLYIGGCFLGTADGLVPNLDFVARYSGGVWYPLAHNGLTGEVNVLAVSGSDLYVGGAFNGTADYQMMNLHGIARYNGGVWYPLAHEGLNGSGVWAFAVSGSNLYIGGEFTGAYDGVVTSLNNIARYSGGAWYPLVHNGLGGFVEVLAVSESDLYVGGDFNGTADYQMMNLNGIAQLTMPSTHLYLPLMMK